jgi:L,D-peptidoglycan transpeptidase YkuD (ErfK/YbiS/YcfS/YnhG family)
MLLPACTIARMAQEQPLRRGVAAMAALIVLVTAGLCWSTASFAASFASTAPTIRGAAIATARAVPGTASQEVPLPPISVEDVERDGCDATLLGALVAGDPSVGQWIVVSAATASSTSGRLQIATLTGDRWVCTLPPAPAQLGRQGLRPLVQRRSGGDTTPAGVFPLGVVQSPIGPTTFFGNLPDPGVHGRYRRLVGTDCYGANPNTPGYGHWRNDARTCTGDDEQLARNTLAYEHAVLIGANTEPDVSGDAPGEPAYAAAIFLHRTTTDASGAPKPTSGCVSIGHGELLTAMRAIDPALNPRFAIGTTSGLLSTPARPALPRRSG